jgi:endonuclease/exonuclease/phosphatase family metal-dependent hydrolase
MSDTIRFMTWNIHSAVGPDGVFDLIRVSDLIRHHNPDILALQEVDARGRTAPSPPPFEFFQEITGHAAVARTITAPDGDYGHMLVSRWPLTDISLHDVSVPKREPRFVIEAKSQTPQGSIHISAVHLGLKLFERRHQAGRLASFAETDAVASVMMGDFNEWVWRADVRYYLQHRLPSYTLIKTFPTFCPILSPDRIYCGKSARIVRAFTDRNARRASDHLPVIADIAITAPAR